MQTECKRGLSVMKTNVQIYPVEPRVSGQLTDEKLQAVKEFMKLSVREILRQNTAERKPINITRTDSI
jgi:hypothetical protein